MDARHGCAEHPTASAHQPKEHNPDQRWFCSAPVAIGLNCGGRTHDYHADQELDALTEYARGKILAALRQRDRESAEQIMLDVQVQCPNCGETHGDWHVRTCNSFAR